jgi:hypothetical protein
MDEAYQRIMTMKIVERPVRGEDGGERFGIARIDRVVVPGLELLNLGVIGWRQNPLCWASCRDGTQQSEKRHNYYQHPSRHFVAPLVWLQIKHAWN